ncbi:VanZ family protein [Christiangramia fulva]|nr:VanZ family protein [Christiangramia fulva]
MPARIFLFLSSAYTCLILWLSLTHLGKISIAGFNPTDKMLHAGAYLFLALLWEFYILLKRKDFKQYRANVLWVALACFIFGMLIEVLQGTLTSYRTPDWFDILANSTGIGLAVLIFLGFASLLKNLKQKLG